MQTLNMLKRWWFSDNIKSGWEILKVVARYQSGCENRESQRQFLSTINLLLLENQNLENQNDFTLFLLENRDVSHSQILSLTTHCVW